MRFHFTAEDGAEQLKKEALNKFTTLMKHGSMSIEYYAPEKTDQQKPHQQDEIYVIISGSGIFNRGGEKINCAKNDILFVPAQMEHRFENFTDDFATWVIFYGSAGGE